MVSEGKTEARPNFIIRFTYKEKVDRNGGRCENLSKQAKDNSALFPCQADDRRNGKGVFRPCYSGRDAPLLAFCTKNTARCASCPGLFIFGGGAENKIPVSAL